MKGVSVGRTSLGRGRHSRYWVLHKHCATRIRPGRRKVAFRTATLVHSAVPLKYTLAQLDGMMISVTGAA